MKRLEFKIILLNRVALLPYINIWGNDRYHFFMLHIGWLNMNISIAAWKDFN